ncbi:MAG: type I 3-dehydroquinate dehydratase [Candidatus Helarchaeota archaeon]
MICVAIAAKNLQEAKKKAGKAAQKGANLVEIRLDYFKSIISSSLHGIMESITVPVIFTLRKKSEGGYFQGNETERQNILKELIEIRPRYVDVELSTETLPELMELGKKNSVEIICSYHDFKKTPPLQNLLEKTKKIKQMRGKIGKIITMATQPQDNLIHFNLLQEVNDLKMICFAMGQAGILSRVFSPIFGGMFTFASLDEKTALGQINISEMQQIYKLMDLKMNF